MKTVYINGKEKVVTNLAARRYLYYKQAELKEEKQGIETKEEKKGRSSKSKK